MGLGPIPRSSVRAYAEEQGLAEHEFDDLWAVIRMVDAEHLKIANAPKTDTPEPTKRKSKPAS